MVKIKIQANPNTNQNTQLMQQIAQNSVTPASVTNKQDQEELMGTVNNIIRNKLLTPIETPKYTTLQDIFDAQKGDKLGVFADFLKNPNTMRTIGNFLPKYGYDANTGKMRNVMETSARREEALMEAEKQRAIDEQKQQNEIVKNVYDTEMQDKRARELAKEELEWRKQENALDRALKRDELNAQIAHQRAIEGIARDRLGGTATGGAAGLTLKQIQKNNEALNGLNAVQSQMDRFSSSFDKVRPTKAGALLANAVASKGFGNEAESNFNAQKTLLFNKIARELGGEKGVLSDQDIKRIEASLPALSDSLPQKKAKMQAIYDLLEDRKSQYGGAVSAGMTSQMNNDPLGLGF